MDFAPNQSDSSHRRPTNGTASSEINHHTVIDLTSDDPDDSIFVTDSSRVFRINEHDRTTITSRDSGDIITTSFGNNSIPLQDFSVCPICCENIQANELKQMPCCSTRLCSTCLVTHTITNIRHGKARIECPACSQEINSSTILFSNDIPVSIRERYQELLAQTLAENQGAFIKLCPHCNFITILDENDPNVNKKGFRRRSQEWIRCEQCTKEWCWSCYAPSHPDETCRQFKKNHAQLESWAKIRRQDNQQRNAQRCPKCSIYIEKIDGCDHMSCTKCNSKFCYRCGARMRLPFYIGHDAKYSIFGCKYKLWPNRPFLRWLVRGSIFVGAILLTPVALAAVLALLVIGIPIVIVIGCFALPIYACIQCKKRS